VKPTITWPALFTRVRDETADEILQNDADAIIVQDAQNGRPARPQRLKKAEVEVKVEQRF
jgi:predicted TIM-barrel enzyme